MTPAHRTDFSLRTELAGLAFQGEDTVRAAQAMIMDVPTSQPHDGTPRHGAGAHSLWREVLAPSFK
jgi:hypothetical protein